MQGIRGTGGDQVLLKEDTGSGGDVEAGTVRDNEEEEVIILVVDKISWSSCSSSVIVDCHVIRRCHLIEWSLLLSSINIIFIELLWSWSLVNNFHWSIVNSHCLDQSCGVFDNCPYHGHGCDHGDLTLTPTPDCLQLDPVPHHVRPGHPLRDDDSN